MHIKVEQLKTQQHATNVVMLGMWHHDEFGAGRKFDKKTLATSVFLGMQDAERRWLNGWIAYDGDEPVGYLVGKINRSFFSQSTYAVQEMWYVVPHYRGSSAALRLLREFERWADERGCERRYLYVEHDDAPVQTARFV